MSDVFERIKANALQYTETFGTAEELLSVAVRDAMPWAMNYVASRRVPHISNLETLCTQLLAIVMSSVPEKEKNDG